MQPHRTARPSAPRATLTSALQRPVLPACLHEGPQSAPEAHSSVSGAGSISANASIPGTNGAHAHGYERAGWRSSRLAFKLGAARALSSLGYLATGLTLRASQTPFEGYTTRPAFTRKTVGS